jgi:hypothetical protein
MTNFNRDYRNEEHKSLAKQFEERADVLNATCIFIVRRIRGAKKLEKLLEIEPDIITTRISIEGLQEEIEDATTINRTLSIKTINKRLNYANSFMRKEYNNVKTRLARELKLIATEGAKVSKRSSKFNAQLVAKFIINEAIKNGLREKEKEEGATRETFAPAQTDSQELAQEVLDSVAPVLDEIDITTLIDPLEGMDDSL